MSYPPTVSLLNESIEHEIRKKLMDHFTRFYGERVESHVNALLSLESHRGRFKYLQNKIGAQLFSSQQSILISGFSVGSEMIAAKQFGFGEIFGVEVSAFYQEMCQKRVGYISGLHPQLYDGSLLPYENDQFAVVASSHVIEHTQSPELYIQECMRVLMPEGYLLLEFPHRYHPIELHTGLLSFEWLPRPIRNMVLTILSGRFFPLEKGKKKLYNHILITNLQQISMARIERVLKRMAMPYSVVDKRESKPGVIRCIIKKRRR